MGMNKIMIIRSTIGFMRDEHWALELAIDEKQNKIKHKESEIRDMKSSFQTSQKIRCCTKTPLRLLHFQSAGFGYSSDDYISECQGTGILGEGDMLDNITVNEDQLYKDNMTSIDGFKNYFQQPEMLENCSTCMYFPPPNSEEPLQIKDDIIIIDHSQFSSASSGFREKGDTHHRHRFINITSEFDTSDHLFTCKLCFSTGVVDYSDSQALEAYGTDSEAWLSVFLAWVCSFDAWIGL
ncbi:hypothetical protein E3N88_18926 [Mikania micrantha]|uniref:Uncharacterized protein n=1 Tax=Mikania micrantha TaxID=192012 RepID=A0A5N6NNE6_9ASTR|nr:hypothetical protein E3N88_18926 [Mikania micrantha]